MKDRRPKGLSRVKGAIFFLATVVVFSIIDVLLFVVPAPPEDLAVITAIVMIVNSIGLAAVLLWDRIRRKRRRDRLSG